MLQFSLYTDGRFTFSFLDGQAFPFINGSLTWPFVLVWTVKRFVFLFLDGQALRFSETAH